MREYKFRGKRVDNGEWVQGYLFCIWERAYILWGTTNGIPNMIEVIPETVGEYTGLPDKNGVEIYDGDFLSVACYSYDECENEKSGIVYMGGLGTTIESICADGAVDCEFLSDLSGSYTTIYEIIGNIHDNPELLEAT